jgi:hypothetical protein
MLGEIWEHPVAAAMIKRAVPEMYENPMIQYALKKSLSELIIMTPQMEPLFAEILKALNQGR